MDNSEFYVVYVMEYERGWGSRCDSVNYFRSKVLAENYQKHFNSGNKEKTAPDWYMVAESPQKINDYNQVVRLQKYFAENPQSNRVASHELESI